MKNKLVTIRLDSQYMSLLSDIEEHLRSSSPFLNELNTSEVIRALIVVYHEEFMQK